MTVASDKPAANEPMPASMRLSIMKERHRALDREIADLQVKPLTDQLYLRRLKREKLRLRDAIEYLRDQLTPDLDA